MIAQRAVVFDIGNVLFEWSPERFYDGIIGQAARRRLFAEVPLDAMNLAIDTGAPLRETVYRMAEDHPDHAPSIRLWHDRWLEMAGPPIEGSVRLLRALRARGVPVFALSNFGVDSFALAERHFGFLAEFDRRYLSGHLRLLKPDPRIYAAVEADCGLPPEDLLFTDDRAENVAAARARGWPAHRFTGPDGLAAWLAAEGMLTGRESA